MARLNQKRQKELTPKRKAYAMKKLKEMNKEIVSETENGVRFTHKGNYITLYFYSGWFAGKGIQDGRGIENLLNQIRP